jgi:alpha-tubulin suppressor-like RCC1 family protein
VFDTCQDGFLSHNDKVFFEAITIALPDTLPPVSPSIQALKEAARVEYQSWLVTHIVLTALLKVGDAEALISCIAAPNPSCLLQVLAVIYDYDEPLAQASDAVEGRVLDLVQNVAKNYGAVWQDPPDSDFDQPVAIDPVVHDAVPSADPLNDAFTGLIAPLADEAALTEGLLHAIEQYQGAQAAGQDDWALVHAREVRDLSTTIHDLLVGTDAVQELRDAVADRSVELDASITSGRQTLDRLRTSGFTGEERQNLLNQGETAADIAGYEAGFVAGGGVASFSAADVVARLDAVIAARTQTAAALEESALGWATLVEQLEADHDIEQRSPVASAGRHYSVDADAPVVLDASASRTPQHTVITGYAWDLDGDGEFDDATGVQPTATFPRDASRVIGVRVTNNLGLSAVAYSHVSTSGGNRHPVIDAASPATTVTVLTGSSTPFSVTASDGDGDALSYTWSVDGDEVATSASFTYAPTATQIGAHTVTVVVSDGDGASAIYAWRIRVTLPDGDGDGWTGSSDCDDVRADIHPGAFERFGNGLDDDCDAGTADGPPGGLTGTVWSWGEPQAVGANVFVSTPTPVELTSLGQVRQVEGAHARGYAVLADGSVRAWGQSFDGALGNGSATTQYRPVSPLGVGGTGTLTGVTQLASDGTHVAAVRGDGSVVAWGSNSNGQIGDGTTVPSRLFPTPVVIANGSPLTGVREVEAGTSETYAIMNDGTVSTWGTQRCTGSGTATIQRTAAPAPRFGTNVVQLESGDDWVLLRRADGSVWACGASAEVVARGVSSPTPNIYTVAQVKGFGPNSGVIDISAGSSSGVALKEDGTVWTWGKNINNAIGVLGVPYNTNVYTPTQVPIPPGAPIVDVDVDESSHTFAVRADGTVLVWGNNIFGAGGIGVVTSEVAGIQRVLVPGRSIAAASSDWNGLTITRPADDPTWDRPAQWITASAADASIGEATGGTVAVTLSEPAPDDIVLTWAIAPTADSTAGSSGTATIARGTTSVAIPVATTDDAIDEDDEQLGFRVVSISHGIELAKAIALVTVLDDDDVPSIAIAGASADEGGTSLTDVTVAVSLSGPSGKDIAVGYRTQDGTATAGQDYSAAVGTALIPAGQTQAIVHLAVIGDAVVEPDETFAVALEAPENAVLGANATAQIGILDDEPLTLDVDSPTVDEGDTGTVTTAAFALSISPPPAGVTVQVPWTIDPGTAVGGDIVASSGVATFDATTTSVQIAVSVIGDDVPEPTEVFRITVGDATTSDGRIVLRSDAAPAAILDDDVADGAPAVDAGPDVSGVEGQVLALTGTVTDDGPVTTTWTSGDADCVIADPTALSTTVTCHDDAASAQLVLTADDGINAPVTDTVTVIATNVAPTVSALPATTTLPVGAVYAATGSVTDPGTEGFTATVDHGDGSGPMPLALDGGSFAISHAFHAAGRFTVTVTVCDDDGGCGTASGVVEVTAINIAPTAAISGPTVIDEGATATLDASGSLDPDGSIVAYDWDLDGDGAFDDDHDATASIARPDDGSIVARLQVTDDDGATAVASHATTVRNVAPLLSPLSAPASVQAGAAYTVSGSFTDPGADTFTATIDFGAGATPLALNGKAFSRSNTYTAPGTYTVVVTVTDDNGGTARASTTVTVTAAPTPPGRGGPGIAIGAGTFKFPGTNDTVEFAFDLLVTKHGACGDLLVKRNGTTTTRLFGVNVEDGGTWRSGSTRFARMVGTGWINRAGKDRAVTFEAIVVDGSQDKIWMSVKTLDGQPVGELTLAGAGEQQAVVLKSGGNLVLNL